MKISIVILNYKTFHDTDKCLTAIQRNPPSDKYEVIVADNCSGQAEKEKEFLAKWERHIRYIVSPKNLGFGGGNNLGAAQAHGEYIVIMNPDIEVWEGTFDKAIQYLDAHKEVGLLGAQLRYSDGVIQDSYRSFPNLQDQIIKRSGFLRRRKCLRKRISSYLMWEKDPNTTEPVDWVVGALMFVRKKAFSEVGGFDERYFLFMEDVDLCRTMWSRGWRVIYNPKIIATHREDRLSKGGFIDFFRKKTLRIHVLSALKYFWKYRFKKLPR